MLRQSSPAFLLVLLSSSITSCDEASQAASSVESGASASDVTTTGSSSTATSSPHSSGATSSSRSTQGDPSGAGGEHGVAPTQGAGGTFNVPTPVPNLSGSMALDGGAGGQLAVGRDTGASAGAGGGADSVPMATSPVIDPSPRPDVMARPDTELVKIDVNQRYQIFEGWGTSLCWWANHVGGWDEAARDAVVDAVVDPIDGMGYNIFRYNIGGGENPAHDHMDRFRDMPGFLAEDGTWDWDADANQRAVLLSIAERGSDVILEAFSNSPPYWMTVSGCASGSSDGSNNLREDSYDAFADYLTEVVLHYRDELGVTFRTLEPLNEPNANWWKSNGTQEGCHFSPSNQQRIIRATVASLSTKGLTDTTISASDENSMDEAARNIAAFDDATIEAMGQINVHSYAGSERAQLRVLADRLGKRLWQSESGPLGQTLNGDMEAAMFMAGRIIVDLRELQPEAWIDWQSGDPSRNWASFTLDDADQTYAPLKRFYMHAGFSRFIRPGAVFVAIDDEDMVAALSADQSVLTIVVRNGSRSEAHSYTFDITTLPAVGSNLQVYRTSSEEDLEQLEPIDIDGYSFVATAPAYSITTFVVPLR